MQALMIKRLLNKNHNKDICFYKREHGHKVRGFHQGFFFMVKEKPYKYFIK